MRLFVAVTPPREIREQLAALRAPEIPRARWVPVERLHVTLRFLGETGPDRRARLESELAELTWDPVQARFRGTGSFGRPPRVIWAGLEPEAPLISLARAVDGAARRAGYPQDDKTFRPHSTLARLERSPPHHVRAFLEATAALETPRFHVETFELYASTLGPEGPRYAVLSHFQARSHVPRPDSDG